MTETNSKKERLEPGVHYEAIWYGPIILDTGEYVPCIRKNGYLSELIEEVEMSIALNKYALNKYCYGQILKVRSFPGQPIAEIVAFINQNGIFDIDENLKETCIDI